MKTLLLLFWTSLLFLNVDLLLGQCTGDIQLNTQAEVDAFAENYGCSVIEGNLRIGSIAFSSITNLLGLESITSIEGNLHISYNSALTNIEGIGNLTSIGGNLNISYNWGLTNIDELENLTSIGGNCEISNSGSLTNIDGLENLISIGGDLNISSNWGLTNIEGLANLTSIEGDLSISDNDGALTTLEGCQNITFIGGGLNISGNETLTNIEGLANLTSIGGVLSISYNYALTNINGLANLTSIGWYFEITNNADLTDMDGLVNLTSIGGSLSIIGNDALTNIEGVQNVTSIGGDLNISYNEVLTDMDGLANVTSIEGALYISYNGSLTNLDRLENLTSIGGNCEISNSGSLTNIDGLENLISIGGDLNISSNWGLTNIEGLANLTSIEGDLSISNNDGALTTLEGCQNLTSIGGFLKINSNYALTNIEGFANLTSIGGDLNISSNWGLTNIDGLANLTSIGGDLEVYGNNTLTTCCSILPAFAIAEGDIIIYNNLLSCNSVETIVVSCEAYQMIKAIPFFDENENGMIDPNEQSIQQSFNLSPSAFYSYTDESGVVSLSLEYFGEYQLSLNNTNPLWEFSGTDNPVQISFQDSTFSDTLHYFPMTPVANFVIQSIDLNSSITRCNQNTNYWLTYTNEGTTINDGYIELIPSDLVDFVSVNPSADSTAGDKLYWFYEGLFPTHSQQIHLVYEMPSVDELGEQIAFEANIETNEGFGDHKAVLSSELICAYDPNDKLVTPFGYGDENYTLFGDTLEYTVRFQNTGNDTAFTVIIEDELSEYLDLNTFRPIASSHNVETRIDVNNRLATFTFNDIYLPDSFVNEVGSHGFVKYQILGNEGLSENTDVKNTANIFFDANPAIVTNTVNNRLVSELPTLPILTANAEELNFGELALDEAAYAPQALVIENIGELALHISQFDFENSDFNSGDIQSISVDGESSVSVPIYFFPSEVGNYQSQLSLQSSVGGLIIELTGSAILGTGVNSFTKPKFKLFPNPNEGRFYLTAEEEIQQYQIHNSLGDLIIEQTGPNTQSAQIDLQGQSKGIYFISVQTAKGVSIQKFLVQ